MLNTGQQESESLEKPRGRDEDITLLRCFALVAAQHGIGVSVEQLIQGHDAGKSRSTLDRLVSIASPLGFRATIGRLRWKDLFKLGKSLPVIALLRNGNAMVITSVEEKTDERPSFIFLRDPNTTDDVPLVVDEVRFDRAWTGEIVFVRRNYRLADLNQPFGWRWLFGLIVDDRKLCRDIIVSAVMLSLISIAPAFLWRLLTDRVLYYGSWSTFSAICAMFAVIILYDTTFGYIRRRFLATLGMRLEVKISTHVFDKVLDLPVEYFERRPVGEIMFELSSLPKIRDLIINYMFGIMLDVLLLVFFLPGMMLLSPLLTLVALVIVGSIGLCIICSLPAVRRRVAAYVEMGVYSSRLLVEALAGIRAVKSLSLEARLRKKWIELIEEQRKRRIKLDWTLSVIESIVTPAQSLMTTGILGLCTLLVLYTQQPAYIGAIIAFTMLAQRLSQPLLTLARSIAQMDDARLAVEHVAHLLSRPPEQRRKGIGSRKKISGCIEFSDVTFRYAGTHIPALDQVSFTIPEGYVFGVVGRSGSGKTTVTRLLQLFHSNYAGSIKIDGVELREFDLDHLRVNLGVVLQENFLFSGPIRETIAAGDPTASFEQVVEAARLAGAEEFIERLSGGYEAKIREGASNLSGGQRQRLAIARALIRRPPILILDEATSALDAESEAIVSANLENIALGRTLIIISHRLASLVAADAILVLERGRVYDIGTHEELLERCDIYAGLWYTQHRHLLPKAEIIPYRSKIKEETGITTP